MSSDSDFPPWIDSNYVENILRNKIKDPSVKVLNCHLSWATKKGENYVSIITRVLVEFGSRSLNYDIQKLIIKSSIQNDSQITNTIEAMRAFEDEMLMYSEVQPKFDKLLRRVSAFEGVSIFPEPFLCDFEHCAIVLEDLKAANYQSADRITGLDAKHTELVLSKLALYHACSVAADQANPGCFKHFDHGIYNRYTFVLSQFYLRTLDKVCEILPSFGGEFVVYADKIRKLLPHWIEKENLAYDPKSDQLNVLTHGDLWTSNIMFKYNSALEEPVDALFFDYQFSTWSSPAIDLHYLFHTSLAELPSFDQMDELIEFYYIKLIENLKLLNCFDAKTFPSLEQFIAQYWKNGMHGLQASFINKAVAFLEDESVACPEAFFSEGEKSERFQWAILNNKRIQEHWKILVPYFDKKGLLDL